MRTIYGLLAVIILTGCLFATDENSNYHIQVINRAKQVANVEYFSCTQNGFKAHQSLSLNADEEVEINVCSSLMDDDFIKVTLGGKSRQYRFKPDFWGDDTIYIEDTDFQKGMPE